MVWEKHLFTLANLILITLGAYLAVSTFYMVVGGGVANQGPESIATAETVAQQISDRQAPTGDLQFLRAHNLFERPDDPGKSRSPAIDIEALAPTQLNLKLLGTVVDNQGSDSIAIIQDQRTRRQDLYHVGDSVQNATVKLILREKAVLTVNGKDEVLAIADDLRAAAARPSPAPEVQQTNAALQSVTLERAAIAEAVGNVNELLRQVRIRPHFENGRPAGLSISRIRPDSLFHRMGLTNGDVIQRVDDVSIKSVPDVVSLYEKLGNTDQISVDINRDGAPLRIDYRIN